MIEYTRVGGIAGLNDRMTVNASRVVSASRKSGNRQFTLEQKDFDELMAQFEMAGFLELKAEYLPANPCCDLIEYTVVYQGHTVRTKDSAIPQALQPLINLLNQIVERR